MIGPKWQTQEQEQEYQELSPEVVRQRAQDRLTVLNHRLGVGVGAVKERMKLDKLIGE